MSYSRWLTSYWYTYWLAALDDTKENRDTALFCICNLCNDNIVFTAKELRDDRAACIQHVASKDGHATIDELNELNIYIDSFIDDVDKRYQLVEQP